MKANILNCQIDKLNMTQVLDKIEEFINSKEPHHIITLNAEIIYKAQSNLKLKKIINEAALVTPDGSGVVWAADYLNDPVPERVTGIDLVGKLAELAPRKNWKIYLYGGAPTIAELAADNLRQKHPGIQILGTCHGYIKEHEQEKLLTDIKTKRPDILLVALGAPRQEYWIKEHLQDLQIPVAIGVGGSLDVISGKVQRAPLFFQKTGLEWLYRLLKEPHRIGRMMALPKFTRLVRAEARSR